MCEDNKLSMLALRPTATRSAMAFDGAVVAAVAVVGRSTDCRIEVSAGCHMLLRMHHRLAHIGHIRSHRIRPGYMPHFVHRGHFHMDPEWPFDTGAHFHTSISKHLLGGCKKKLLVNIQTSGYALAGVFPRLTIGAL